MPSPQRLDALDALRGLVALAVVVFHDTLRYPRFMLGLPMDGVPLLPGFSQAEAGTVPVLCFFLISGFVITWTMDRCKTPADFIVSRVSRIYPAYWASLAVTASLIVLVPLPGGSVSLNQVLVNITMLQDIAGVPQVAGVYWSLTVELVFYAYAFTLFSLGLWRRAHIVTLAWSAACLASALLALYGLNTPWRAKQLLLLEFGPLLAAGMALYWLWRKQNPVWATAILAVSLVAIFAGNLPGVALICIAAMALIARIAHGGLRWMATPPLLWLGAISYSLYLSHETASYIVIRAADAAALPHGLGILLGIGVALMLATAITYGIERPAMRWIRTRWRRVTPSPAPRLDPAATAQPKSPAAPG